MGNFRNSGIEEIGEIPWGMHICYFYYTPEDYFDILIPYFKQGLRDNECCIWMDTKHIRENEIEKRLKKEIPEYKTYIKSGQFLNLDYRSVYYKGGKLNLKNASDFLLKEVDETLKKGYDGVRLTGDAKWLKRKNWDSFIDYENTIRREIRERKIITLCTYPINKFIKRDILEIANSHSFALFKKKDGYSVIKSSQREQIEKERAEIQSNLQRIQHLESLGVLSRSIAHDFNNLLGLIKGYNDMALMNIDKDEDVREYLKEMSKSIKSAAKLIDQLHSFHPENPMELNVEEVNINELITQLLEMFSYFISENIKVETNFEENLNLIKADAEKLNQVIMNLVLNARDAIKGEGKISIMTKQIRNGELSEILGKKIKQRFEAIPKKGVLIKVKDNGVGMNEKIMNQIFQPFFTTKPPGKGTGLGLTIVKTIVNQHSGIVDVESDEGKGSVFKIFLPAN